MHIEKIKFSALRGVIFHVGTDMFGADAGFLDLPSAHLEQINVFGGRNGSGKSTLLDVVRALSEPRLFQTLKRSALNQQVFHGMDLTFRGGNTKYPKSPSPLVLHVEFESSRTPPVLALRVLDRANHDEIILDEIYSRILPAGMTITEVNKVNQIVDRMGVVIGYWRGPEQVCLSKDFVVALRSILSELAGVDEVELSSAADLRNTASVNLRLSADPTIAQAVPFEYLPSGWKAAAGLLAWVKKQKNGAILVIEEPETHLHPRLQRVLAMKLAALARKKDLQLLVSSHSSVFLSPEVWKSTDRKPAVDVAHFHVDGQHIRALHGPRVENSPQQLLNELGVRASDLYQANFVIWVEGPSDRIYIKYWLERWCQTNRQKSPLENVHYSFVLYGGSVLSHYQANEILEVGQTISMLSINRNSFVVVDCDHDFKFDQGVRVRTRDESSKYKILDALSEDRTWITHGYTVEWYLPRKFGKYLIRKKDGTIAIGTALTKVELAKKYVKDTASSGFRNLFKRNQANPINEIAKIFQLINDANK